MKLNQDDYKKIHPHLIQVSRSFAFCIDKLESPLREKVGLMYLMCRVIDTFEDTPWGNIRQRSQAFESFLRSLSPSHANWELPDDRIFHSKIKPQELSLLHSIPELLEMYWRLNEAEQEVFYNLIQSMSKGMLGFLEIREKDSEKIFNEIFQLNAYCFFVAGIVGEALTRLVNETRAKEFKLETLKKSIQFGLFLQKINILKDEKEDALGNRNFVKNFKNIRTSIAFHAKEALEYVENLVDKDFKTFCAWSFFLGLETLLVIDRNRIDNSQTTASPKVGKVRTLLVMNETQNLIQKNQSLKPLAQELFQKLDFFNRGVGESQVEQAHLLSSETHWWPHIINSYKGVMSPQDIYEVLSC
jgi:phytoene/squalene synthetase